MHSFLINAHLILTIAIKSNAYSYILPVQTFYPAAITVYARG